MLRPTVCVFLAVVILVTHTAAAVRGERAEYIGGTASVKQGTQGRLDVSGPVELLFTSESSTLKIRYQGVTSLEFGQKIGRRVGATIALGVTTLGLAALPLLFSKKKRHYLTIGYTENGTNQAAVFELAKNTVRATLATLEARTGKPVERDDTADLDKPKETTERARTPEATAPAPPPVQQSNNPATILPGSALAPQPKPKTPPPIMTNVDIVKMIQAGMSQDLIIATIRACQPQFSMLPAVLEGMTRAGVSPEIIKAMAARANGTL
jgi:hypothetical protein